MVVALVWKDGCSWAVLGSFLDGDVVGNKWEGLCNWDKMKSEHCEMGWV
jgi:hypothetical protein